MHRLDADTHMVVGAISKCQGQLAAVGILVAVGTLAMHSQASGSLRGCVHSSEGQ